MASPTWTMVPSDLATLRELARRKRELAALPVMAERRRLWLDHNDLRRARPMFLAELGGVLGEVCPSTVLTCREAWARGVEHGLRLAILQHELVGDDAVITPTVTCGWWTHTGDYGVRPVVHQPDNDGKLGARSWEPALKNLAEDFGRLRPRTFAVDRAGTLAWKALLEEVFDGLLEVRLRHAYGCWTMGMTGTAIDLIGLENLMLFMYDDPAGLHRLMGFLRDDHLAYLDWLEREGLLTLNNENDYVGSGGIGYTRQLPARPVDSSAPVRARDLWVLSESQETVGVGPELFAEFIFPYQEEVVRRFGLCYYGCCEPVHSRWSVLQRLPNLRKVSVSPWCDQVLMAANLGPRYVFARKPNPTLISTPRFDEEAIRRDLRETLAAAWPAGCPLEFAMKDVHTLQDQPWRLGRWVALAREEADRFLGA